MTTKPETPASGMSFRAVPGPGFAAGCIVTTWVAEGFFSRVAYVLIGHAPPRRPGETSETITEGLMGMVDAMNLRPAAERVPIVGARLRVRGPLAALDYGHPEYLMRLPAIGDEWRTHVVRGGPVCLTVGLDPIPPGAGPDAIAAYLDRVASTGRAYMGATTLRAR
ncbi:hypothetical protein SV1_26 [Streptomyces phage SV1]|uniref:hypothetical protein n=1 Tax=Streptomyces phage SV1 TaxID=1204525 RepID=UPI00028A434F|nr:hypothetical protein D280_gp26 [Streptomyces phage SV1]AFU62166.1 hypothetical protein SV1_26 [Streptomyces phage SV1]